MKLLKGLWLPALVALAPLAAAAKDAPLVEPTDFDSELLNIFYFDDSDVAMLVEFDSEKVFRSTDAGKSWAAQDGMRTSGIVRNPYDSKVAVVLGAERKHWITYDRGEEWKEFETESRPDMRNPLSFHAKDSKKILFHDGGDCPFGMCLGKTYYTKDGFQSKPKLARDSRKMCLWAKGTERFGEGVDGLDDRILCITAGKYSNRSKDYKIVISDDYFENENEPVMSSGRTVQGMTNMAAVKGYFVAAAKAEHSNELAMYVTDDTKTWHHAEFGGGKIEEDAYTMLESTNYSIQVDVVTDPYAYMGSLYTSNSNGTYFTRNIDHTNRNEVGYVDFEKVSNIQGIVMVNVVDNADDKNPFAIKKIKSKISFDDGRTFEDLSVKDSDEKLHLHSVTQLHNSGRVFSSPAPGIVMGVGNTGKYQGKYTDGDLWVSDDAGLTWERALKEAHKYEFGGQGAVLVAVYDEGETDKVMYSLKHGRPDTWKEIPLKWKFRAQELTTVSDSTSLKFILYGSRAADGGGRKFTIVHLDFAEMHERECGNDDLENWSARKDDKGDDMCVMGHKQTFKRRKWDAECFLKEDFKEALPSFEPCDCDEVRDYECDYNFVPEGTGKDKKCNPAGSLKLPEGACKGDAKTYKGSSGWRKIPGNQCKGETDKDKEVERNCDEAVEPPASGDIKNTLKEFEGSQFKEYYYLERPTQQDKDKEDDKEKDETVVMLTDEGVAWKTHDHGKEWEKVTDENIVAIYPHQYNNDRVFFLTSTKKFFYSKNRGKGKTIHNSEAPQMPTDQTQILQFHPKNHDWLIWTGGEHCEKHADPECHTVASVSQNNGLVGTWEPMMPYVRKCAFVWREAGRQVDEKEVFCEQHTKEDMDAPVELISSEDWFKKKDVKFKSVVAFATMSEFILVATKGDDPKTPLKLDASLDAKNFAEAKFPANFEQTAYTVLDSSTHSVFLHVTVNGLLDQEYGSIIKSNSNGTSYVMSLNAVNRNAVGYVDFEKMQGIEGVAVATVVANTDQVNKGEKKRKQTRITHNDGADWQPLKPPAVDSDNKKYECSGKGLDKCALHLHGYTERPDPRESYSSPTAVGLMMGVGNVGEQLTTIGEASTFITTDAGVTWKEVKKGNYAWEYGDQGSVIAIVRRNEDTNHLYYSLDNGDKWTEHKFADSKYRIDAISTVPSDTSLNFLLWGKNGKKLVAINVDFRGLFSRKCDLHEEDPTNEDYELWSPQHPMQQEDQECLFGHVAQYHRKRSGRDCYNGERIDHLHNIARNCTCTRQDFECDYNYERMPGGECVRIEGLSPPDPQAVCAAGAMEWWDVTGYRKIPISTCEGGKELEHTGQSHPCAGHEEEYERKHGVSGFVIFLAIVLPFAAAGAVGYYVWKHWDGKFGRIRLGENTGLGGGWDSGSPWVQWPAAAISGLVAVVAAIPLLVGAGWRAVSSRFGGYGGRTYTSRSSFARGRGDYAVVDPDEGELLGEDSDEDV